jgi:hypothetical protein
MNIDELKRLAGIGEKSAGDGSNISITGNDKARIQREHNIKPGTPELIQLWFSRPTGERPYGDNNGR